jgi:primosomal protein N' (replication factor Y)
MADAHRQGALKTILATLDAQPIVTPDLLRLTEWMAEQYLLPWGVVLEGIVPAGVRRNVGVKQRIWYVRRAAETAEQSANRPTSQGGRPGEDLPSGSGRLTTAQRRVLAVIDAAATPLTMSEIRRRTGCTASPVLSLLERGWIESRRGTVFAQNEPATGSTRTNSAPPQVNPGLDLNGHQSEALQAVRNALQRGVCETLLLFGVTGSGKTEVYIQAIESAIARGKQAIVLVPEISLTAQTRLRFAARFQRIALLHSHLKDVERHGYWQRIVAGEIDLVIGARSAIFAPLPRLGLIVIDEEHDSSYKQDSQPRYHAREVAGERARIVQCPLVLGSATPSLESWSAVRQSGMRLLRLPQRVSDLPLPEVRIVDLRDAHRNRGRPSAISRPLRQAMKEALAEGGQLILFMNRRGYSTMIQCPACGYVVSCPNCERPLTMHLLATARPGSGGRTAAARGEALGICHQCDFRLPAPRNCPQCSFEGIAFSGFGTQTLEQELAEMFPNVPVLRMDADTMRGAGSHEEAFERFRSGQARILLGTQMIAKGLDFPDVTLVGVVNADMGLHLPDFRAAERTFQLVTQVAGRTGRSARGGLVIVQTYSPDHYAIQCAAEHDLERFAELEMVQRGRYHFPPCCELIRAIFRGEMARQVEAAAAGLVRSFQSLMPAGASSRILGPAPCPFPKISGRYRFHALFFDSDAARLRRLMRGATEKIELPRGVQYQLDVNPTDMM